ncbi:tRNA (adenosine(37)-N6)-threonylcarbamoyltransferase complex ATPase subunit type 1 TsaE [Patescibacteria group bacterium]|nr:tRNA (adenosine(37)-N6)-threonylcarbamoyltransferase complex ATPase subunit type 1 TsaE [Patescibacteria group bacterium]
MEVITNSTKETKDLAERLAKDIKPGVTLALYGDLGSGKTTFTRFLVEALGSDARVQSPTFVVARKYKNINHIDLYRLTTKEEVRDIGIEEFLSDKEGINIIEWPELAEEFLPKDTVRIYFEYVDDEKRKIRIQDIN